MRKLLCLTLTLALVFTFGAGSVFAADTTEATTMKIAGTDGTVTITTDKGKDIAAKVDTKLLNGYTIKTAAASYCFIALDDSKAIKLGQNTKVKVEKSGKKIELSVKSGEIYFDVDKKLSGNESMNIKTGNMTTGIRGTSGSVKVVQRKPASAKNLNAAQAVEAIINLFSGTTQTKMGANGGAAMLETVTAGTSLSVSTSLSNEIGNAGNTSATLAGNDGRYSMPQVVVKGAAALDPFAARAILENAAIKSGVSVGEALSAPTAQIVEKAADALEGLSLAGSVKEQLTVQTSDPQTLDAQIAGEEQQAVQQTEEVVQTIEGAKEEAAQVEGTTSDTAESKVIEKVEVKTGSGADAGKVTFEGGGVTVSDTPSGSSSSSSTSSGNSGGTVDIPEITGYVGIYDGQEHPIGTIDADLASNYHVVLFDNEAGYSTCKEAMRSIDSTGGFNTADERYAMLISALDANEVSYEPCTSDGMPQACNVADSHTWNWYALPKVATDSSIFGSFNVSVSRAEISVKWVNSQTNEEVAQNAVFPAGTSAIPVVPLIGVYRTIETETHSTQEAFSVFGSDDSFRAWDTITTESGETGVYFEPVVSGNAPQGQAGNYTVELTSIMHDEDGNNFTGTFQTDNFYFSGQGKYYSYSVEAVASGSRTNINIVSGSAANSWMTGYTGTYDTEKHFAISPTTAQNENYYIWLFGPNADEEFNTVKTSASALIGACTLAEPTDTLATELQGIREQLNGRIDNDDFGNLYEYSSQVASALDALFAENVSESGTWHYVAIPKTAQYDAYIGQFGVNITKAPIVTKWYWEYYPEVEFINGGAVPADSSPIFKAPEIGIMVNGDFVTIEEDYVIAENGTDFSDSKVSLSLSFPEVDMMSNGPGRYYATTTGINYTYNDASISGKSETENLYVPDGALSVSFNAFSSSYDALGNDFEGTRHSFFSEDFPVLATLAEDRANYDIAFVATGSGSNSAYTEYHRGVQAATGVTIGAVFNVLQSPSPYATVCIDTGNTVQVLPDTVAPEIVAFYTARSVMISGAGITAGEGRTLYLGNKFGSDSQTDLYVKLHDATTTLGAYELDGGVAEVITASGGNTGSTGPSNIDSTFFSHGNWEDRTEYDIAFVANGTQSDPSNPDAIPVPVYDKYFKGDTVRSEAGCSIEDIVAVLANTTSYASVYIDTGDEVKPIGDDMIINTGSFNRAVFISGAGFSWSSSGFINTNANGTNGELYIKLGSNESDVETKLENVQSIYIASKATFINSGEFTLENQMQIYGDVQNYGEIYISAAATGSLDPITISSGGILEQYDGGMIWDKREIKLNSNSSLTGGRTTYKVNSGGTMKLLGGSLRRSVTSDSAEPEDTTSKVALRARAIFSVQGTERIDCNTGNYYFEPVNQAGDTLEAVYDGIVLCTYTGGGTVLGARLDGETSVLHEDTNGDFPSGTFFVTGSNSSFNQSTDEWFVEITFPHPNGTFTPTN